MRIKVFENTALHAEGFVSESASEFRSEAFGYKTKEGNADIYK